MITENYFKMCEKAEGIQKKWKPQMGDWYVELDGDVECVSLMGESIIKHHSQYHIWLPTLEQLFDMVDWDKAIKDSTSIINNTWKRECREGLKLYLLFNFYKDGISNRFNAIKEILFAFVMHEKYNKIWTGKKWIEKSNERSIKNGIEY